MDFNVVYCPLRRTLEERGWNLVSRLSSLSARLLATGENHSLFLHVLDECKVTRLAIHDSRLELRKHRDGHGC